MQQQQTPVKTGLLELLKKTSGGQFVIPVYQRNYIWTAFKEVKQYLNDLEDILNKKYKSHFFGIIIYLDTRINFSTNEFSIIDGQQRLTTTFLILYAIKRLMLEKGDNVSAQALENQYLINQYADEGHKFKLKPLVSDDDVFVQIVNGEEDKISNKNSNVYKNYVYIYSWLNKLLSTFSFNDILLAIEELYIVCIPVTSEDGPQRIFESINSTGAKLMASDLIRNYILMDVENSLQEKLYDIYWKKIEEKVSSDPKKLEGFFRIFLACKELYLVSINSIYEVFKDWFNDTLSKCSVEGILNEILEYAKIYNLIYIAPPSQIEKEIQSSLIEFRKNLTIMPAPLLMELYKIHLSNDENGHPLISKEQYSEVVTIINAYIVRRSICAIDTSDITRLFPTLLKDILDDCSGDYKNLIEILKKNLINKNRGKSAAMPTDEQVRNYLKTANVYNNRVTLKVIFDHLETLNNTAPVDLSKLSIEHLMPQTPTEEWYKALNTDKDTYDSYLNKIGNLTLASKNDNSKMRNNIFDYKKDVLKGTNHIVLNQDVFDKESWTLEEIDKRTDILIEKFISSYPYYSAADSFISKKNIYLNSNSISATAILYEENSTVEVQEGSQIAKFSEETLDNLRSLFGDLLDNEIIKEVLGDENIGGVFIKPYIFGANKKNSTGLSSSAGFILGGSRNGWEYWKDENGVPLKEDKEMYDLLRAK